ncbi:Predicted unusual protein kinase regulating ubiquinone biosynthesis, AarF/ABC1/UbiB family [Pedococcus dokdonensis]|uniref:Predicted unusual protein kinase regulating ubiquinone biosynthesis, AarF/ABC1/UbiB family n=1 Tax=Pedococcus dokdonensis TaxID=443156 RepID=A0A1H0L0T4_9MICO|nr:AarF/ABC1/UbiB kinase family protein [Pedococcus dokdonensis]SDO61828.1 Predicted unusual protein kinase regulating ubiquinone biosynthesis, AarF/ABC1/UbiB family [Pedococcus dokdonensis]
MNDLPRRAVTRTARLASLPLGFAGRTAVGLGKRVGGKPAEAVAAELQARTADQLFKVLGELKGGAMKFGQAMSVMEAALPEEMAGPYRATLTKLQEAAPPLPAATVHKVLAEELGPRWRTSKFQSFDDTPAAAASIGQVHKAVWRDGREVAVKIQYPGAGKALLSDLNQLARVARLAGGWIPGMDIKPITDELKSRMSEELDYNLEASNQRTFAKAFRDDPEFAVPDVLVHSEHVIVSEWMEGIPLSRIVASGTPEQRDAAAERYMAFLLVGPARAGLLHADPHPGNFRLLPDGRLGVIDYGAVNRLPDGLPAAMGSLVGAALRGEASELEKGLRGEGFIKPSMSLDAEALLDYLQPFIEPLTHAEFTFSRPWLRGVAAHVNDVRRPEFLVGMKLNLPPSYLLIHRVWLGGIGVLCQLGGTVPARQIVVDHMPGMQLRHLPPPVA